MTSEEQKSWDYAMRGLAEHVGYIDTLTKMIDVNVEITDKNFNRLKQRLKTISAHIEMAQGHTEILNVINQREIERREAAQTKRLQAQKYDQGNQLG